MKYKDLSLQTSNSHSVLSLTTAIIWTGLGASWWGTKLTVNVCWEVRKSPVGFSWKLWKLVYFCRWRWQGAAVVLAPNQFWSKLKMVTNKCWDRNSAKLLRPCSMHPRGPSVFSFGGDCKGRVLDFFGFACCSQWVPTVFSSSSQGVVNKY